MPPFFIRYSSFDIHYSIFDILRISSSPSEQQKRRRQARAQSPTPSSRVVPGSGTIRRAEIWGDQLIEAGAHTLQVVHPGHETREVDLELAPGEEIDLEVRLEPVE